jgi:hypothetical protein
MPRLRCRRTSDAIAVLVWAFGWHPHNWLAQQLQFAAVSALIISDTSHLAKAAQASPTKLRSLH